MSRLRAFRLGAMIALALATVVWASLALVAINTGGAARIGSLNVLEISAGYDHEIGELLGKEHPTAQELDRAERGARAALGQYPYNSQAWLRLALADVKRHGRLTTPGLAALRRSYDLVALEPNAGPWRVAFGLQHWQELPKDLQNQVRREAFDLGANGKMRVKLQRSIATVTSPYGMVLGGSWVTIIHQRAVATDRKVREQVR